MRENLNVCGDFVPGDTCTRAVTAAIGGLVCDFVPYWSSACSGIRYPQIRDGAHRASIRLHDHKFLHFRARGAHLMSV